MTTAEKLAALSNEDKARLAAVTGMEALSAFLTERGIELADDHKSVMLECIMSGVLPIEDDELNAVAGGGRIIITDTEEKLVKQLAARDGRTINLPSGVFWVTPINFKVCLCHHKYKWCKECKDDIPAGYGYTRKYRDVKCYNCEKTWMEIVN